MMVIDNSMMAIRSIMVDLPTPPMMIIDT